MNDTTLQIILKATDQASATVGKVSQSVGGLEGATSKLGLASVIGWGAATAAVVSFAKVGMGEVMEGEKVMAQTEAAIKSTGAAANMTAPEVEALAGEISELAAIDDELVQSAANVMLTFTNVRNEIGAGNDIFNQANLAAANLSTRLGGDLQGSVLMLGKALNDPIAGMTALSRAGVQFTDGQRAVIRSLVESNDLLGAQKLILAEVEKQVGGSAEAYGNTLGGQLEIVQIRMENAAGTMLEVVVPAIVAITGVAGDAAIAVGVLAEKIEEISGGPVGDFVDKLGDVKEAAVDLPGPLKAVGLGLAFFASPVVASGVAMLEGGRRAIDALSDSAESSGDILGAMAAYIRAARADTEQYSRATAESASRLWQAPKAAMAVRDSLAGVEQKWRDAAQAAADAEQAFFDALNTPSPERAARNALVAQAELNVAKLQQQVDAGQGDMASSQAGFTKSEYLDWLTGVFIPTQKEWLEIDSLQRKSIEAHAEAMKVLGGDVHDWAKVASGEAIPNMQDMYDSTYDATTALDDLVEAVGDLTNTPGKVGPIDASTANRAKLAVADVSEQITNIKNAKGATGPIDASTANRARLAVADITEQVTNLKNATGRTGPIDASTAKRARLAVADVSEQVTNLKNTLGRTGPIDASTARRAELAVADVSEQVTNLKNTTGRTGPIDASTAKRAELAVADVSEQITNLKGVNGQTGPIDASTAKRAELAVADVSEQITNLKNVTGSTGYINAATLQYVQDKLEWIRSLWHQIFGGSGAGGATPGGMAATGAGGSGMAFATGTGYQQTVNIYVTGNNLLGGGSMTDFARQMAQLILPEIRRELERGG